MPLKPIDLQTLFMQMNQVSKDQAAAKEGAALHQANALALQQKKALEKVQTVNNPQDDEASSRKIDDQEGGSQAGPPPEGEGGAKGEEAEAEEGLSVYKDPDVGRHVDISG